MKHISILVLKEAILSSIDTPKQLFSKVNEFLIARGKSPMYEVQLVGTSKETIIIKETYTIQADELFQNIEKTHLIIVPMICGDFPHAIEANKEFIP